MTLRNRILCITLITIFILTSLLYAVVQYAWRATYTQIEELSMRKNVGSALSAIEQSLENLKATTRVWSAWNDAYQFIASSDEAYIASNLIDATASNLQLNLMLYQDVNGRVVYGELYDLESGTSAPVSPAIYEALNAAGLSNHIAPDSERSGVVMLPEGPMLVVSLPILDSEDGGRIQGSLILGRAIDAAFLTHLEELTQLDLEVSQLVGSNATSEIQALAHELSGAGDIKTRPLDEHTALGYTLIEDIHGEPAILLRVKNSRPAFTQGINGIGVLVVIFILAGLFGGLAITLYIERHVLKRLSVISQQVSAIAAHGDRSLRVHAEGKDELSRLVDNINQMLDSSSASQAEPVNAHAELALRNQMVMETNQALQNEIQERRRVER
ncbi:MAG: CHASE4 domain-containing protein, partial [Anaerolineales bacterium]|nr:CHASE4 domain-containing protein [Anaerolineales bacterium]